MKKVLFSILVLLIGVPTVVSAEVDQNTQVRSWDAATVTDAATQCANEENNNNASKLANADNGHYLYCVAVACNGGLNVHTVANPISKKIKCSNGNTNPYAEVVTSGANGELRNGAACSQTGTYLYATEKMVYNCMQVKDASGNPTDYVPSSGTVASPDTGVEDYYMVLGSAIIILSAGLYTLNKKNVFKKI